MDRNKSEEQKLQLKLKEQQQQQQKQLQPGKLIDEHNLINKLMSSLQPSPPKFQDPPSNPVEFICEIIYIK
uniref:HDC00768 n=1 Tax=Drosophila melanogaster TaxID=7227 RepID=Q6IHV7_DROME|nr:TPA_inf: HDC00768 [Drosophila melanogaster]